MVLLLADAGLKWGEFNRYGQPSARACRFDNICFNAASQHFEFYRGVNGQPLFYDQKGQAHFDFPADFVNTGKGAPSSLS